MKTVYLVDGLRTPIGKTGGMLKKYLPEMLGAKVLNGLLERNKIEADQIDQVILGNAVGPGGNLSRVTLLEAGWPFSIPGITIDYQCGSGMSSVLLGCSQILSGQAELIVAGGLESTSLAPIRQFCSEDPRYNSEKPVFERAPFSPSSIGDPDMGEGAENLAKMMGFSRGELDTLALQSHQKATKTLKTGILDRWILPLEVDGADCKKDESIREKISEKLLQRMPSVFVKGGVVTAGNACLTHDGAAALLLASGEAVGRYGLQPIAKFVTGAHVGTDPNLFALAPVFVIKKLLQDSQLVADKIDAIEINEAFAVKILACAKELKIDLSKINRLGGALAYGHPYGASGTMIIIHLMATLQHYDQKFGLAAIGVGGGVGAGILLERC